MGDVHGALREASGIFQQRNAVYQDAYLIVGKVTAALFPDGVELKTEEDHNRWHLFELIIVKMTRYSANWEEGHHDSLNDIMVYAAMIQGLDNDKRERSEPPS